MRHFRSFRGSRRRSMQPAIRTAKYIIVSGPSSAGAGIEAVTMAIGTDNATLGQTGVTDTAVPTGCKIESFEIFMPKSSVSADVADFVQWTIQKIDSGQSVVNPITAGGDPLRKNIMLSGSLVCGFAQNNGLHVKYRVPKGKQRMGDGQLWTLVNNNQRATQVHYYIIYKVQM